MNFFFQAVCEPGKELEVLVLCFDEQVNYTFLLMGNKEKAKARVVPC